MKNKNGWTFFFEDAEPVVNYKDEYRDKIRKLFIDLLSLPFFLISLLGLYIYLQFFKKERPNKILLGTVPIITFELLSKLLKKHNIDNTLFVFTDWTHGSFHSGLTFKDLTSSKFLNKDPYGFGSYIAFLWALKNFDIFVLYFNGGFLERTNFWKMEALIYQIFHKKTLLIPYGGDTWSIEKNNNRIQKLGHMMSCKKYFLLDKKRQDRIYHWSKYVNLIIAYVNYMDYLVKIDILVYHGHIIEDVNNYKYNFTPTTSPKVIHSTGNRLKKGGHYIEALLANASFKNNLEFCYGLKREDALKKLDDAHFYIEQVIDGFINYSSLEAMLKGKIVFLYLDENLNDVYKVLNSDYYIKFFEDSPVVNINAQTLETKIEEYLRKDFKELQKISLQSKEFAKNIVLENETMYIDIFRGLID